MRVVLDTATIVSAIRSDKGAAAEILRRVLIGHISILADYKLICEYRDVCVRQQHLNASGRTEQEVREIVNLLEAVAVPVSIVVKIRPLSPDVNDDMVLDVAINGRADAIVTNNLKHFVTPSERFGVGVLTPKDFLVGLKGV